MAQFCPACGRRVAVAGTCPCGRDDEGPTTALRVHDLHSTSAPAPARLDLRRRTRQRSTMLTVIAACLVALTFLGIAFLAMSSGTTGTTAVAADGTGAPGSPGTSGTTPDPTAGLRNTGNPAATLEAQRQYDLSVLSAEGEGYWYPQLSSKRVGTRADGRTYDAAAIWAQFEGLKSRYPQARLVWANDWGSFRQGGYWVVLVDSRSTSGADANAWCDAEGYPADSCYAKRLSRSGGYTGNTLPRG